jgi:hypothetical protein
MMVDRTAVLDALMREHGLTARKVGELVRRKPHTVRCWRSKWVGRVIPEQTLELLQFKLQRAGE